MTGSFGYDERNYLKSVGFLRLSCRKLNFLFFLVACLKFDHQEVDSKMLLKPTAFLLVVFLAAFLSFALLRRLLALLLRWLLVVLVRGGAPFALGTLLFWEVHLLDVRLLVYLRRLEPYPGLALDVRDPDELLRLVSRRLCRGDNEALEPAWMEEYA